MSRLNATRNIDMPLSIGRFPDKPVNLLLRTVDPSDPPPEFADEARALGLAGSSHPVLLAALGRAPAEIVALVPFKGGSVHALVDTLACALRSCREGGQLTGQTSTVAVHAPIDSAKALEMIATALSLTAFDFTRRSGLVSSPPGAITSIHFVNVGSEHANEQAISRAEIIARWVHEARIWVNEGPSDVTPSAFAATVQGHAEQLGNPDLVIDVSDTIRLREMRCAGLLAVGRGSDNKARLVHMSYTPSAATAHVALVGKGITFDSGGLSLKSPSAMVDMKGDMAGAAAVAAAVLAAAELDLPVRIDAYLCVAENMPGGGAFKPGDVLTMRNGKTVEITNTDAEGRIVLADGLCLAAESNADAIVDVATLTGAAVTALGYRTGAILGNSPNLVQELIGSGERTAEPLWELPITKEAEDRLFASRTADLLQADVSNDAGAIYASAFLRHFVDNQPWAHLDIAGSSFNVGKPDGQLPSGATGAGVKTLLDFLTNRPLLGSFPS